MYEPLIKWTDYFGNHHNVTVRDGEYVYIVFPLNLGTWVYEEFSVVCKDGCSISIKFEENC